MTAPARSVFAELAATVRVVLPSKGSAQTTVMALPEEWAEALAALDLIEQRATDMERKAKLMLAAVVRSAGGEVTVHPKSMREDHDLTREEGLDGRITFHAALSAREDTHDPSDSPFSAPKLQAHERGLFGSAREEAQ